MSTITTIQSTDLISASRSTINTNFANLNTDKAELSGATFTGDINVPDEAYGVGWNGSTEVPTKNAVYDKIETMWGGGATTFLWLTDTPSSYSGQALKIVQVNAWATALEFVSASGGWDALTSNPLSQFASTTSAQLAGVISDETWSGALVFANSPTLVTPALGTPSSGTLTNCTGLPLAGIVDINTNRILGRSTAGTGDIEELNVTAVPALIGLGTSDSPQFTWVNVWHATDTTITRVSAGVIAVEGVTIPTISSTNTVTNKRIQKRVVTTTQSATPTINTDNWDIFQITGLAQAITSMTSGLTGTPVNGEMIVIQITDNGTARAITWWASFEASTVALPTTTVISTRMDNLFIWNSVTSKWRILASV